MEEKGGMPYREATHVHRGSNRAFNVAKKEAVRRWVEMQASLVNANGEFDLVRHPTKEAYVILKGAVAGHSSVRRKHEMRLKDPITQEACTTHERTAQIYSDHLRRKFSDPTPYDADLVNKLPQRPIRKHLSNIPTADEIRNAVWRQRNGKAMGPAKVPPEAYKAMTYCPALLGVLHGLVKKMWTTGSYCGEHPLPREEEVVDAEVQDPRKGGNKAGVVRPAVLVPNSSAPSPPQEAVMLVIHADGACEKHGTANARAGVGVYFGDEDPRNISVPLEGPEQTHQRAELMALVLALDAVVRTATAHRRKTTAVIKSDSNYCVKGYSEWVGGWVCNDWYAKSGASVANQDLWKDIYSLQQNVQSMSHVDVRLEWVKGHTGDAGNEAADRLAVRGIRSSMPAGSQIPNKIRHQTPPNREPTCKCCGKSSSRSEKDDTGGMVYEEWVVAQHVYVPKKRPLNMPKNWRSICVLDILGSVVTAILAARIRLWSEYNLPETQNGFRARRGTLDSIWTVNQVLRQRRKAGLTTWVASVDLRTAFDSVSREAIFHILSRYGFPDHFINVLKRFHTDTKLLGKIGSVVYEIMTRAGVRTGDTCGPDLFNICMKAIFELIEWPPDMAPEFWTSKYRNGVRNSFKVPSVEFADDCIFMTKTRAGLAPTCVVVKSTAKAVTGMQMHDAATPFPEPADKSKTVCMVCPAPGVQYDDLDTSPLKLQGKTDSQTTYVHFAKSLIYLGIVLHFDLGPVPAMEARRAKAASRNAEFAMVLRSREYDEKLKGRYLVTMVLPVLLYGSVVWSPTSAQEKLAVVAWNSHCRSALRITTDTQCRHRIKSETVWERLGVKPLQYYMRHRRMCWLGKVAKMGMHRLPRRLLSSKVKEGPNDERQPPMPPASSSATNGPLAFKRERVRPPLPAAAPRPPRQPLLRMPPQHPGRRGPPAALFKGRVENAFTVEKTKAGPGRLAKCNRMRTTIQPGEVRFKYRGENASYARYFSVAGIMEMASNNPALVRALERDLPGLDGLGDADQTLVRFAISPEAAAENRKLQRPPILPVSAMPWTCSRCSHTFNVRRAYAERHAQRDDCTARRRTGRPQQPVPPPSAKVYGKKRTMTWEAIMRKDLQKYPGLVRPFPGCKQCQARATGKPVPDCCDRCFYLNWVTAARVDSYWHRIVYSDDDKKDKSRRTDAEATS